ncbi:juvenile hormone esterase [Dendroctonus ponderosae]|uniref:Carboxylesterase type B domain-containing protein n=1 Tax=Dendroctonus ponderosae TaxID=77166 RepID=A0AAR5Q9F8_DENPD|nr:juvenile hormone esterase [Dendroctonus ponderosae]XP_048526616.1 juvenile hormone esterase [Dendroctonus ponderosae]
MAVLPFVLRVLMPFNVGVNPVLNTTLGPVKGNWELSSNNIAYVAFTGIPFAKPPIGDLRFSNPERADAWTGTLDATRPSPRCAQRNYLFFNNPAIEGSEDCLYLNIYVPVMDVLKNRCIQTETVMAGIHWGGFLAGGSDAGYLGPNYFMNRGVILVTFNYRLGIFGFLSTLDNAAPGNFGLKDQVMALKWIKQNIGSYGGNPEKITIFGQSAGAASVHFHLVSKASNGLFARAISQSGNALAPWALPNNTIQLLATKAQGMIVNCNNENTYTLVNCLRNISVAVLLQSQDAFKIFHRFPFTIWSTVVETETACNPNPFITPEVMEDLKSGNVKHVPWMTGVVQNEGLLVAASMLTAHSEKDNLNQGFNETMIKLLGLESFEPKTQETYRKIFDFYLHHDDLDVQDAQQVKGFIDVWSDRYFVYPLYKALRLQLSNGHNSIYLYNFEYSGEYTYATPFSTQSQSYSYHLGPSHCDDLLYQYATPDLFNNLSQPTDLALSNIWLGLWTNFAIYGEPNPAENKILNISWDPLPTGDLHIGDTLFLNVTGSTYTGVHFSIWQGFYEERIALWEQIESAMREGILRRMM